MTSRGWRMGRAGDTLRSTAQPAVQPHTQLVIDACIGLVARMTLALATAYRSADADTFAAWARTLRDHPLGEFYALAPTPDHLPGDLWLLKAVQLAFTGLGGHDFDSGGFELLTNVVPMVADVLVGILLFHIVTTWASDESGARAARWYLLNPAVVVLAGAWGQWDSVSVAVLLTGLLMILRGGWFWIGVAPMLAWAALIKPQLAVPAVILVLWTIAGHDPASRGSPRRPAGGGAAVAASLSAAVVTTLALLTPFRVGLAWAPAGGSSLLDRVQYAADLHPFTTMGAANIWMVLDRRVIGPPDDVARWGALSAATVGAFLLLAAWSLIGVIAWRAFDRARRLESLVWAAAGATYASCLMPTRIHERYYFPALVLVLVWTALRNFDLVSTIVFWGFSALFVVDLVVPMGWTGHDHQFLHRPATLVAIGVLHIVLFVVLLAVPWSNRVVARSRLVDGRQ